MIEATNLTVSYPKRDVVKVKTLSIRGGQVTALVGPNAAGKSTLLRCLAGMLRPKAGIVTVDGHNVHRTQARIMANLLAFVGQETHESFAFTVRELVQIGAAANTATEAPLSARVDEALDLMELSALADRDLLRLSGGERQRAAIARAIAQAAPHLMLDEPTAHLDLRYQAALMNACRTVARGLNTAVLIVLHDLNLAAAFSDRVVLLDAGEIVADGIPDEVLNPILIERVYQTTVRLTREAQTGNRCFHLAPTAPTAPIFADELVGTTDPAQ